MYKRQNSNSLSLYKEKSFEKKIKELPEYDKKNQW